MLAGDACKHDWKPINIFCNGVAAKCRLGWPNLDANLPKVVTQVGREASERLDTIA